MRTIHLPVAEPCHEDWDAMDPEARGRFCQRCSKSVHDLAGMTEAEAQAFLREKAGTKVCVRYAHDGAGNVRFRRPAALAIAAVALAACTPHDAGSRPDPVKDVPGRHLDLDRLLDVFDEPERHVVGEMIAEPLPAPSPPEPTKPEPTKPEPSTPIEVEPPRPDTTHMRMGMVAVEHEPCDPPKPTGELADLPTWNESMR